MALQEAFLVIYDAAYAKDAFVAAFRWFHSMEHELC
jgi:hypothetical protein